MAENTDTDAGGSSLDAKDHSVLCLRPKHDDDDESPNLSTGDSQSLVPMLPSSVQLHQEISRAWEAVINKKPPLTLLDLPVDVPYIDLLAVASTHSALYKIAMPNIYAEFDIVWPDMRTLAPSRRSMDALSYGLAALCLPNRFAEKAKWPSMDNSGHPVVPCRLAKKEHAQYVRRFAISNGESLYTSDYLIRRETGKNLGTLAAIAVSKMINLETFKWDMPTGVLSDTFMALASLEDEKGQTKLENVWVRWHDNFSLTPASAYPTNPSGPFPPNGSAQPMFTSIGKFIPSNQSNVATAYIGSYADNVVEYPTFSILPPLKSLTVLNIDEMPYLDEMSVLIERSVSKLQELQVGIARKVCNQDFVQPWDGPGLQQVDLTAKWPGDSRIPLTRLGGVLGVLVGRIHDLRAKQNPGGDVSTSGSKDKHPEEVETPGSENESDKTSRPQLLVCMKPTGMTLERKRLAGILKLRKLSLERVPLSIGTCLQAFDWSIINSLTILECRYQEDLWKALKRFFQPRPEDRGFSKGSPVRYELSLRHLLVDRTSPELISFLRKAIAPNTMESVFLLDRGLKAKPRVTLKQIFKAVVKRHQNSLVKLSIDCTDGPPKLVVNPSEQATHWAFRGEFLSYITSGRLKKLKELGMVIDAKDWHIFLQRLPLLASLRAIHILEILNYNDACLPRILKELAIQAMDVMNLAREIQLQYLGICRKCFEFTEVTLDNGTGFGFQDQVDRETYANDEPTEEMPEEEVELDEEDVAEEEESEGDTASTISSDNPSEADSFVEPAPSKSQLRLRSILFPEDKVALFRARHGEL
ncbi:hypothetical protein GGS21DRAFT_489913 [Xylaria nigripes]|nr:hypothetical protein GGS21DRAFT_489913 [Xylaria nigripes]